MEPGEPEPSFPLEEPGPLSRSLLWELQRRYFAQSGMAAWSEGVVPMYVTSNPFIARAYARVVAAYLRDWEADVTANGAQNAAPVYVVELGAGSGRFAFNFLRKFRAAPQGPPEELPIRSVMTEYNEALLDAWQAHPALKPFVAAGALDFAVFDGARPGDLALRVAGRTLKPTTGPLVLIANYFFDSIPQDAFYVEGHRLHESQAALVSTQAEADPLDPAILGRSRLVYERRAARPGYYGDEALDGLLEEYRTRLDASGLAFPSAALRCIQFFDRLSAGRLLLLSSDKGYHRPEELEGRREPGFEVHGSLSMGVNYHALGRYFERGGGLALYPPYRHLYLATYAFLLGRPHGGCGYRETRRAYAESIGEFGPEDFFLVQTMLDATRDDLKPEQGLALLRLSGWDGRIFEASFASLLAGLPPKSADVKAELIEAAARLWDGYYHIGETYDLAYDLGVLSYRLDDYRAALAYFDHSLALYGRQAKTLYNICLCHYLLHEFGAALASVTEALRLDPKFEPGQAMQRRLQNELRKAAER